MFWNNDKKDDNTKKDTANENDHFVTQYYSYCRTVALAHENDPRPIYWETFCQPNSVNKWELRQVMARTKEHPKTGKEINYLSYKTLKKNLDFQKAIHKLSQYERGTEDLKRHHVGKTAEDIGMKHFIVVTEIEGLLFDEKGYPHKVLDGHIPETNGFFMADDVEDAIKNYTSSKDLEAISELKNYDASETLARIFNAVAMKKDHPELVRIYNAVVTNASHFELALESIEDLRNLDDVYRHLNRAAEDMKTIKQSPRTNNDYYRWTPPKNSITAQTLPLKEYIIRNLGQEEETGKPEYKVENLPKYFDLLEKISDVHDAISGISADDPLKISIQNTAFITEVVYNILYANLLFQNSRKASGGSSSSIETIRALQNATEKIFKTKLDITNQNEIEAMKQLVIHNNDLTTPQLVKSILNDYKDWRSTIEKQKISTGESPIKLNKSHGSNNPEEDVSLEKTVSDFLRRVQKIAFNR